MGNEPNRRGVRGYKVKRGPPPNRDDDPAWRGYLRMQEIRRQAMRRALETGEPYRDPFEDHFRKLQRRDRRRYRRRRFRFLRRLVHLG